MFRFRLATLLRLRESAREERRLQLAQAFRAEELVRGRLGELDGELTDLKNRYRNAAEPGRLNVDLLMDAQRYELVVKAERIAIETQMQTLEGETERRRQALIAADREVRVLEKLREAQHARHWAGEARADTKILDEIAGRRAAVEETD